MVSIKQLKESKESLAAELRQGLFHALSGAEQKELQEISASLPKVQLQLIKASEERASLEQEKQQLEMKLTNYLLPRQEAIESRLGLKTVGDDELQIRTLQAEADRLEKEIDNLTEKQQRMCISEL